MTPANFGYKIIFSHHGVIQPPIYAYFSDFVDRGEIARIVWQHAESAQRNAGATPNADLIEATFEDRLESSGCKIVSYKRLGND